MNIFEQNKIEDGITIHIVSTNRAAPGSFELPLTRFLLRFETLQQRNQVLAAVHACLRASAISQPEQRKAS